MNEIQDHLIYCPEGFYDMQRYPERIEHGKTLTVTKSQFRQMKNSDPSIELRRIEPPKEILAAIVTAARAEKAERDAEQVADLEEWHEAEEYKPVGWYAAQLAKNGGLDE